MTSKQLYWTDAHFCGLRSQSNIYGLSKITSHGGLTKLLAVSINGHFVTVEYQKSYDNRLIPITREDVFFMAGPLHAPVGAGDIEIVSVDMIYQNGDAKDIVLAVTYLKLAAPYEEKSPSAYMNIYFLAAEEGSNINLVDAVAMSQIQSLMLDYFPLKLMHYKVDVGNGQLETCFILSGNDNKVHVFRQEKDTQAFYEDQNMAEKYFPEFSEVNECVTQMEFRGMDERHRLSAFGTQRGRVCLFLVKTVSQEIERRWQTDMDSPITSLQLFSHNVSAPRPHFLSSEGDDEAKNKSSEAQVDEPINLLITSAIDPSVVFCDVMGNDLNKKFTLPNSNTQDVVLCSCIMDIDFDGENEILIGTYGQVLLAYKMTMERTPGMLMTSTPFPSPKPVPVMSSKSDVPTPSPAASNEDKSGGEQSHEKSDRRRHKSLAGTLDSSGSSGNSPSKHEKHDRHRSDDSSLLDAGLKDGQMARLVRSQENLATASPRSVYFQTPDTSDLCEFPGQRSLHDVSDYPGYRLKWTKRFPDPVMGLISEDMMGDGMMDLAVLTLRGLHILQPDLNEVAELLLERLRPLCRSQQEGTSNS